MFCLHNLLHSLTTHIINKRNENPLFDWQDYPRERERQCGQLSSEQFLLKIDFHLHTISLFLFRILNNFMGKQNKKRFHSMAIEKNANKMRKNRMWVLFLILGELYIVWSCNLKMALGEEKYWKRNSKRLTLSAARH